MESKTDVKAYLRRLADLERRYQSWRPHYEEINEFLCPRKSQFLSTEASQNDGAKLHNSIIDSTGGRALRILAAGMQSGLTSPARPWFKLGVPDKQLQDRWQVKNWLEEVRKMMLHIFQRSNFYNVTHSLYKDLAAFGTAAMSIDADYDSVIRCYGFTIGEYYLAIGPTYRVDSIYRNYWLPVRNVVEAYGEDNVSVSTKNMYNNGNGDIYIRLVHVIEPNPEAKPWLIEARNKPYRSVVFEYASHGGKFLSESGYDSFPVMAPRWEVTGNEVYGRSPGMETLGDIKMLQKMQKKSLIALDKMVDPPMNAPLTLKGKSVLTIPGGVNYIDTMGGSGATFTPAYQVALDFSNLEYKIERVQAAIREGLFSDLFLMLSQSPKNMTATEVMERHEEKLLMLGPVIERIQPELLDLAIDRTFQIMLGAWPPLIPPAPPEMQGMELEVEYISLLAQAQKMVGITAIEQTAAFVGNLATVKPEVLDKFDQDEAVDIYADMVGVPPKLIVPDEDVQAMRQERAQQIKQQQMMEQGAQLAQGAKTLSETDTGGNNALTALMGGFAPNMGAAAPRQ